MSLNDNDAAVDILCEFFEVAIHNILYFRNLYPKEIFAKRKKYSCIVYQSIHPQLNEYINESLKAVKFHSQANKLKRLLICIASSTIVHERYVFDVLKLVSSDNVDPVYLKLENNFRNLMLRLHSSTSYLDTLPETAGFKIMIHTTETSSFNLNRDCTFDNFPWLNVSENDFNLRSPEIVPVHTVDSGCIEMQIYVEKCNKLEDKGDV